MYTLHMPLQADRKIQYRTLASLRKNLREMWGVNRLYSYSFYCEQENGGTKKVTLVYPSRREMQNDHDGAYATNYYRED